MKISVVISAYNAEATLKSCLESVKWADEIIFVDNSSTDGTSEIAKKYTKKIFKRQNNLMLNVNKNFGFSKATGDWILCLDSDEEITDELKREIEPVIDNQEVNGYWIPRKNIIFGKWIEHTGWYPDYQLRLFRKNKGKFAEKHVHEMIEVQGLTEQLKEPLIHQNYKTVSQFLQKHCFIYAPNEAEQLIANGYEFNWLDFAVRPHNEFVSRFFAQKGYKDGLHGFVLSLLMGFYHLIIQTYIWEKNKFVQVDYKEEVEGVLKIHKKLVKELKYWFLTVAIDEVKNPLARVILKIKRRSSRGK